tara:strand:+ start:196 stop:453 length:258 start_codon:yes stop_codon:yes gene_type:complete
MYIRLRTEWNSYWEDSVLELSDEEAGDLIRQRIAIPAKKDDCMKSIGRAPRDKMLWGPTKDKAQQAPKDKKKRNERSKRPEGRIE